MTTRLPHSLQAQILSDHNLRVSQKSMEFKDPQETLQLLIGKSASKRYKILASGGRSPAEVLAVAIAQVET